MQAPIGRSFFDFPWVLMLYEAMLGRVRARTGDAWRLVAHSLPGRLLLLTVFFVMIGEVLIFTPSVGRYYRELLDNHIASAELAILPFTEPVDKASFEALRRQMLKHAGASEVLLKRAERRQLFIVDATPAKIDLTIDLTSAGFAQDMVDAIDCLLHGGDRTLYVIAPTHIEDAQTIGIILNETPIREALASYAWRVVATAFFVSAVTAGLVFVSLFFFLVRPMGRITRSMIEFRGNPEDSSRIMEPSNRRDEIGLAERELAAMQRDLYGSLQQKTRLAALGAAVARIQHDLRNILSSAQLASDRLAAIDDPVVKRLAPRLVSSIDRAVSLATATLRYGRAEERAPERKRVALKPLIDEAGEAARGANTNIVLRDEIDSALRIDADPEQLFRMVLNLMRNAVEALAEHGGEITASASRDGHKVAIDIADSGPGIPQAVRDRLFQPFASAARSGGSGLGLAIARDLARAHGGDISLVSTGPSGTRLRIVIPDRAES
jgi:signal transduction histidine kinase